MAIIGAFEVYVLVVLVVIVSVLIGLRSALGVVKKRKLMQKNLVERYGFKKETGKSTFSRYMIAHKLIASKTMRDLQVALQYGMNTERETSVPVYVLSLKSEKTMPHLMIVKNKYYPGAGAVLLGFKKVSGIDDPEYSVYGEDDADTRRAAQHLISSLKQIPCRRIDTSSAEVHITLDSDARTNFTAEQINSYVEVAAPAVSKVFSLEYSKKVFLEAPINEQFEKNIRTAMVIIGLIVLVIVVIVNLWVFGGSFF